MATTKGSRLYRGASGRADITRGASPDGRPEPLLLLPRLPSISGLAAATLSVESAHRTRQDIVGKTRRVGHRCQSYRRIQRHERVLYGVSPDHRPDAERLSPALQLTPSR